MLAHIRDSRDCPQCRLDPAAQLESERIQAEEFIYANSTTQPSTSPSVHASTADQPPDAGTGQAKSYAYWLKPAYYVTTNGDVIVVYNYQGGAVPDVKVLDFKRADLRERFDDLYRVLNPKAAAEARQAKVDKLRGGSSA